MMNDHDSAITKSTLEQVAYKIQDELINVADFMKEPSVLYRPRLFIDGDKWCALYGENIQDGVAGFGSSPERAMLDFNNQWSKTI